MEVFIDEAGHQEAPTSIDFGIYRSRTIAGTDLPDRVVFDQDKSVFDQFISLTVKDGGVFKKNHLSTPGYSSTSVMFVIVT